MKSFDAFKAKEGAKTLGLFLNQFGQLKEQEIIVLDYILKLMLEKQQNAKALHIPSQPK